MTNKDTLYRKPRDDISGFTFDDNVVSVFPDMINRSVPGYSTIIAMTGILAGRYARNNSNIYDLGCSLGASTFSMQQHINTEGCNIIAVDNSPAMINKMQQRIDVDIKPTIETHCKDIEKTAIENASVVVLNFSLQFITPEKRNALLQNIANNMLEGGILVLSEKIAFEDSHLDQLNTDLHHEFKKQNGYSEMEISQKRTALENVLIPETIPTHQTRLANAGFSTFEVWFQCFNFVSLVAIK